MKKPLIIYLFLLSLSTTLAQNLQNNRLDVNDSNAIVYNETHNTTLEKTFAEAAEAINIPQRKFENLKGVKNGYYAVTGVYSDINNIKKQLKKLKKKGLASGYITNLENNLKYIYASYSPNWQETIAECNSKFDGAYTEDVWILNIEKSEPVDNRTSLDKTADEKFENSKPKDKRTNSTKESKLIEKADYYFSKMWYAEAAELYEEALNLSKENYSYDILEKAGDSHYFNTNMEKAYHWYNILYENYQEEMSADNVFKYAHSLKGTGKYARSKRLMRIYNKKLKKKDGEIKITSKNETILDNILKTSNKFEIKNLAINSEYSEFSPIYYNENKVVFASAKDSSFFHTRRYKWNDQPYLDLYVAKVNEESKELKNAIKFSKKINTKYHEASVAFSPDNKTMYFTRNNYGKKLKRDNKGINHLKIYTSKKINGEWTEATELPFNSDNYSTGHPALSSDGKELYFVSDMPGSIGQTDIFVVDVFDDGKFSTPRNLGPQINTEKREMFPFINDKKLYFSSDGHTGLGGLDIYEATFETKKGFLNAVNLGQPINSNLDDFSYIINEESQDGYFASNRKGGKGDDDIYSFKRLIPEEVNKNAIAGVVTDLVEGEIMPQALIVLLDENNIKLKEVMTNDDGGFIFEDLEGSTKYTIKTSKGDYFDDEQIISTKENELVTVDVSLKKLKDLIAVEEGIKKLKIDNIYFDFDKSHIKSDAKIELDKIVTVMNEYPEMIIKIESHTDSRGSKNYNKYLSNKRANSSKDYLISKGVDANRIQSAVGYGEEKLLNGCDGSIRCTEKQHSLNRRSEFIIVKS